MEQITTEFSDLKNHHTHGLPLMVSVGQEFRARVLTQCSSRATGQMGLVWGSPRRWLPVQCWAGKTWRKGAGHLSSSRCGLSMQALQHELLTCWLRAPTVCVPWKSTRKRLSYLLLPIFGSHAAAHLGSLRIKGKEHRPLLDEGCRHYTVRRAYGIYVVIFVRCCLPQTHCCTVGSIPCASSWPDPGQ